MASRILRISVVSVVISLIIPAFWVHARSADPTTVATLPDTTDAGTIRKDVVRTAGLTPVHAAFAWFRAHQREISDWQLLITNVPAPPFGEQARAEWVRKRFQEMGLERVQIDDIGNVIGIRPGTDASARYVAITAHLDTVFPPGTKINARRDGDRLLGPGVSDNGAGLAALLAIISAMDAAQIRTDAPILFVGNVGEEGEGDIRGIRHLFAEEPFRDSIACTLVIDGAGTDSIVTQALGSRRYLVTVSGPGGHSWSDFGVPNPVVALARAIDQFSRSPIPENPKTTFNIGVINGGTSVNSIPQSASMRVDIRSASTEEIQKLERSLREALDSAATSVGQASGKQAKSANPLRYDIQLIGNRPAAELSPESRMLAVMSAVDQHLGINSRAQRASTDANIPISQGREALAIGAGGTGGGAHTLHEWFDPTNRDVGLKRILLAILTLSGVHADASR